MTEEIARLQAQVAGQRLALIRLLTVFSTARLEQMVETGRAALEAAGPSDRAAIAEDLALLEEALNNRLEHEAEVP